MELKVQVLRDEAQWCVPSRAYLVPSIAGFGNTFFVSFICWEGYVKVHSSATVLLFTSTRTCIAILRYGSFIASRVSLLFIRCGSLMMQAIDERLSFLVRFGAFRSVGCPSY